MTASFQADIDEMNRTVGQIRPLLAGKGSAVQGAILAELVAMYLAGHLPALRKGLLELHVRTACEMIPLHHERIRGHLGETIDDVGTC